MSPSALALLAALLIFGFVFVWGLYRLYRMRAERRSREQAERRAPTPESRQSQ